MDRGHISKKLDEYETSLEKANISLREWHVVKNVSLPIIDEKIKDWITTPKKFKEMTRDIRGLFNHRFFKLFFYNKLFLMYKCGIIKAKFLFFYFLLKILPFLLLVLIVVAVIYVVIKSVYVFL